MSPHPYWPPGPRLQLEELDLNEVAVGVQNESIEQRVIKTQGGPIPVRHGDRVWLFLDYGEPASAVLFRSRWIILLRPQQESLTLVAMFPYTDERALDMLAAEVAVAREAMAAIRAEALLRG